MLLSHNQIKMINQTKLKIIFREFICTTKTKIKENVIKQVKCQQVKIECQNVFKNKKKTFENCDSLQQDFTPSLRS